MHLADGEYFKLAAYDDVYAPELVERCIHVLDHRSPVVLCYTKSYVIDEHGVGRRREAEERRPACDR